MAWAERSQSPGMWKLKAFYKCQWSITSGQPRIEDKGSLVDNPLMEFPGMDLMLGKMIDGKQDNFYPGFSYTKG